MAIEYLEDIPGALHMYHDWGERFFGWYLFKKFLRSQKIELKYKMPVSYEFGVYEYRYRFIMPSKLEFCKGIISYSVDERLFGVFRFPRDENGQFSSPVPIKKTEDQIRTLTAEEIMSLIGKRSVLVFEAFRIPQHIFEFISVDNEDVIKIKNLTDDDFCTQFQRFYTSELESRISEVKMKIKSGPNILLILRNTLDRQWKDMDELAYATDNILHIYGSK